MSNPSDYVIENGVLIKYVGSGGDVVIPEGVTSIGEGAFRSCKKLKSVTVPEGVINIGCFAFKGCDKLTDVLLPDSVLYISGDGPFDGTALYRDESCWDNGLLYVSNCLIKARKELDGVCVVREGTRCIASSAFSGCKMLNSVVLPEGLVSIGEFAFSNCEMLSELSIPNSLTELGFDAFQSCRSLRRVILPEGIRKIEGQLFFECSSLTELKIPEGVTSIGSSAFFRCSSLKNVTIPKSVTSIGSYAFDQCYSLTEIVIPEGVTCIDNGVFSGCGCLTSVHIPESVNRIGNEAFRECRCLTGIKIPEGVTEIGDRAFLGCSSLTELSIPEGVIGIGDYAFADSVLSITLPGSLERASENCFSWRSTLQLVRVKKWNSAISTVFRRYTVEKIVTEDFPSLPTKYRPAGALGFITEKTAELDTEAGKAVLDYLMKNAGKICAYTFDHPELFFLLSERGLIAAKDVDTYISEAEKRGDLEKKALLLDYQDKLGTKEVAKAQAKKEIVKEDYTDALVKRIAARDPSKGIAGMTFVITGKLNAWPKVWENRDEVKKYLESYGAFLGSSVTKKTDYLVTNDTNSGSEKNKKAQEYGALVINEDDFNDMIGKRFKDMPKITIPAWLKVIPSEAFRDYKSLKSITIPEGIIEIGNDVFCGTALENVEIPNGVTYIGNGAFRWCKRLNSVSIPESVKSIGARAFDGCESLAEVIIPSGVTEIGTGVFYGCSSLTHVTIPESVKRIGKWAFDNCPNLIVHAPAGSVAEKYAKDNSIPFVTEG